MRKHQSFRMWHVAALQSSGFVFVARLAGAGLGLLIQILLARMIGGEQLGLVYIALAVANIGGVIAALGYPSVCVRFIRRYLARGKPHWATIFRVSTLAEVFLISLLLTVGIAMVISLMPLQQDLYQPLFLGLLMIPLFALLSLNGGMANAFKRVDISYLPDVFLRPLIWFVALTVLLALGGSIKATEAVATAAFATLLALLIQFIWLSYVLRDEGTIQQPRPEKAKSKQRSLWRQAALPMIVMTLMTNMIFDIDVLILSPFLTPHDLALFGVAFKIAFLIGFGVHITQQAALPAIADAYSLKQTSLMRREIVRCVLISSAAAIISSLLLLLFGAWILSFFGQGFVLATFSLFLLSLCSVIRALSGPATQLLVLAGRQKQILFIYGSGIAILAIANAVLVPTLSIDGAALALVVTTLYWSIALSVAAYMATRVRTDFLNFDLFDDLSFQAPIKKKRVH